MRSFSCSSFLLLFLLDSDYGLVYYCSEIVQSLLLTLFASLLPSIHSFSPSRCLSVHPVAFVSPFPHHQHHHSFELRITSLATLDWPADSAVDSLYPSSTVPRSAARAGVHAALLPGLSVHVCLISRLSCYPFAFVQFLLSFYQVDPGLTG